MSISDYLFDFVEASMLGSSNVILMLSTRACKKFIKKTKKWPEKVEFIDQINLKIDLKTKKN